MQLTDILYEKREGIAVATFNRPDALNAWRSVTFEDYFAVVDDFAADDNLRVLVFTGSGRAFSAGIDLKVDSDLSSAEVSLRSAREHLHRQQEVTRLLTDLPKAVICAMNGLAVGMGLEMALNADIRIATDDAYFMFSESKRALFQTNGVMYYLPRLVGYGRAMEMLLTARKVPAQEALSMGLITQVTTRDDLMPAALELAETLCRNAPISLRLIKQVMRRTFDLDLDSVMQLEVDGMLECLTSEDLAEGTRAFIEKRAPIYKGR